MKEITVGAGFDPAFRSDACAGVIVIGVDGHYYSAATFERKPTKGTPLRPSVVTREFAQLARSYGAEHIVTDGFYVEAVREHVQAEKLELIEAPSGQQGKANVYMGAREQLHGGHVHIPASQQRLIRQLGDVVSKPQPGGGISITSPRKRDGHGDLVSAFVLALWRCEEVNRGGDDFQLFTFVTGGRARERGVLVRHGFRSHVEVRRW